MAVLVDKNTRLVCQGITGGSGTLHSKLMISEGTNICAGVTPKKGGQFFEAEGPDGGLVQVPIYNTVREAVEQQGVNASVIFVPPRFAMAAIIEAVDAGIKLIVAITEGIPANDMLRVYDHIQGKDVRIIGPNCPGIITPGECKIGIMPYSIHTPGKIGVVSRSGTLTYEAVAQLSALGIGQSTCIGIGGDPIIGTTHTDAMKLFNDDPDTLGVIMIGEIGGSAEEDACLWVKDNMTKPVVGFIAGATAPPGRRMGHAGAIVSGGKGTAQAKFEAMEAAGIHVEKNPAKMGERMKQILEQQGLLAEAQGL